MSIENVADAAAATTDLIVLTGAVRHSLGHYLGTRMAANVRAARRSRRAWMEEHWPEVDGLSPPRSLLLTGFRRALLGLTEVEGALLALGFQLLPGERRAAPNRGYSSQATAPGSKPGSTDRR